MNQFCTECGEELRKDIEFCEHCGTKITSSQSSHIEKDEGKLPTNEERLPTRKKSNKNQMFLFSLISILILSTGVYFFMISPGKDEVVSTDEVKAQPENTNEQKQSADDSPSEEDSQQIQNTEKDHEESEASISENDKESAEMQKKEMISDYMFALDSLTVGENGPSVGEWEMIEEGDQLTFTIANLSESQADDLFSLYDAGEIEKIRTWASNVYTLSEHVASELDMKVSISVQSNCISSYAETLPSSVLMDYSGSCGYSIPILSGSSRENLTLFVVEDVFVDSDEVEADSIVNVEEEVTAIRDEYYKINDNLDTYIEKSIGKEITKFESDAGIPRKIVSRNGEDGLNSEYYFWEDGSLFFVFTTEKGHKENRYYFKNGRMIRWINENKETFDLEKATQDPELKSIENKWMERVSSFN